VRLDGLVAVLALLAALAVAVSVPVCSRRSARAPAGTRGHLLSDNDERPARFILHHLRCPNVSACAPVWGRRGRLEGAADAYHLKDRPLQPKRVSDCLAGRKSVGLEVSSATCGGLDLRIATTPRAVAKQSKRSGESVDKLGDHKDSGYCERRAVRGGGVSGRQLSPASRKFPRPPRRAAHGRYSARRACPRSSNLRALHHAGRCSPPPDRLRIAASPIVRCCPVSSFTRPRSPPRPSALGPLPPRATASRMPRECARRLLEARALPTR
jgi:hypothetical protein